MNTRTITHDTSTSTVSSPTRNNSGEISSKNIRVEMSLPLSDEKQSAYRKVAKSYCRVVTAIDDEIYKKGKFENGDEGQMITRRFDSLRQSCEDRGMLCHLLQFPDTTVSGDNDLERNKHLSRAVASAKAADVVILDWNLGHKTEHGNALHILESLAQSSHVGFVMIYTQQKNLKAVSVELENAFKRWEKPLEMLPDISNNIEDQDEFETGETDAQKRFGYHLSNRLFLFLSTKDEDDLSVGVSADHLIDVIYNALVASLHGRLKWAGLELMARIRDILPQIVAVLPDADPALLSQILFQREDEVAAQVAESLLDEIRHALIENPLEIVGDKDIFNELKKHMIDLSSNFERWGAIAQNVDSKTYEKAKQAREKLMNLRDGEKLPSNDGNALEKFNNLAENWKKADLTSLRETILETSELKDKSALHNFMVYSSSSDFSTALAQYLVEDITEEVFLKKFIAWAEVRESVLLTKNIPLRPGAILRKKAGSPDDAPEWLFCQTGACDCYRPTGYGYLFLAGKNREVKRSRRSETQSCVLGTEIVWDAAQLHILQNPTEEHQIEASDGDNQLGIAQASYEIVGALRSDFTLRTIQRGFSHQSRIGVDTSELIRQRRGE